MGIISYNSVDKNSHLIKIEKTLQLKHLFNKNAR